MCLSPTPLLKPLISELTFALTNEALYISRNRPSAASQHTDHPFFPSLRRFAPWTIENPATSILHSYLLILENECNHFHTLLCMHQKLREATLQAFPNHHHLYNPHIQDVLTQSVQFITCLILVVAKLSDATIQHRLRWYLSAWKVYVCDILSRVSQSCTSSLYTALGTQT